MTEAKLFQLEEQFWTGDAAFYDRSLAEDCVMVFPEPAGVMTKEDIVRSIATSQRWREVDLSDKRVLMPTPDVAIVSYCASARREGQEDRYRTRASSVYTGRGDEWTLAFHQQTPLTGA